MRMLIREPRPSDSLENIVSSAQSDCRAELLPRRRRLLHHGATSQLFVEVDGAVVGVASLRTTLRHPRLAEVAIDVQRPNRSAATIGDLADAILERAAGRIVEARVADDDPVSAWPKTRTGFTCELVVRNGSIPTGDRPPPGTPLPAGYAVEAVEEATRPVEELFERLHAQSTAWAGESVMFPEGRSLLSEAGDAVAIGVVWNRVGSPVAGTAVVVDSDARPGAVLLPGGVIDSERILRTALLAHAVEATLRAAARSGVPRVEYEDSRPNGELQGLVLDRFERTERQRTEVWVSR